MQRFSLLKSGKWALGVLGLAMFASVTNAASIGIQLTGNQFTGNGPELEASDSVGLTGYAQQNWNVFNGDTNGDGVLDAQVAAGALNDDSASATSATVTTSGFDRVLITGSAGTDVNEFYKHGFAISSGSGTVSVSGLAASGYATYDLIVYFSDETVGTDELPETATLTVNGNAMTIQINNWGVDSAPFGGFEDSTNTATNGGANGNYVRLTGLSGDLTVALSSKLSGDANVGINGLQIIQAVPEPASLSLLAAGGLLVLARCRNG